jgi:hypothetical protein
MRVRLLPLVLLGLIGLAAVGAPTSADSSAPGPAWGKAIAVRGITALTVGHAPAFRDLSCASAGDCVAGGEYGNDPKVGYSTSGFIVEQTNGRWDKAFEVPGLGALNTDAHGHVWSISCTTPGNCLVGGWFGSSTGLRGYVAEETNGTWGNAMEVPGLAALNVGMPGENADSVVDSVSCASPGNCAAGGTYTNSKDHRQAWIADETNGVWKDAVEVPGVTSRPGGDYFASVESVSCATPGNCAAGGSYDAKDAYQPFVVDEKNGVWGNAIEVPGSAALNRGHYAHLYSVSCATAGNCAAAGDYSDNRHAASGQAFVADERNGVWRKAIEVPGTATLNRGHSAAATSVSCGTAGNCAAGGSYELYGQGRAFVVAEKNGHWLNATAVPGTQFLPYEATVPGEGLSISCVTAGTCTAATSFLVTETKGSWGKPAKVGGPRRGGIVMRLVSCSAPRKCAAAGGGWSHRRLVVASSH